MAASAVTPKQAKRPDAAPIQWRLCRPITLISRVTELALALPPYINADIVHISYSSEVFEVIRHLNNALT